MIGVRIPKPGTVVHTVQVAAWRCPGCHTMHISQKSGAHIGECWKCNKLVEVRSKT